MTDDNKRSTAASDMSERTSDAPVSEPKKRLEELLIEDDAPKTSFRELADQEVKSGKSVGASLRWSFIVLALLLVAVGGVVVGWYLYGDQLSGHRSPQTQVLVEKRLVAPARPQPLAAARQARVDTAQEVAAGDGSAVTQVAGPGATGAAAAVVSEEVVEVTVASSAVIPAGAADASGNDAGETAQSIAAVVVGEEQQVAAGTPAAAVPEPVHLVLVGPFISQGDLERAAALLRERGYQPQQQHGTGTVDMIRLLEGIYPLAQAQQRLEEVRKGFSSAFLLPDGERWALYIGSFSDRDRARRQQQDLAEQQIQVVQVDSQLTMEGPMLIVSRSGLKAAEEIAAEISAGGLRARIEIER